MTIQVFSNLRGRMFKSASQPARLTDAGRAVVGRARPGRIVLWPCGDTAAVASIFGARFRHSLRRTSAQRTIRCTVERSTAPAPGSSRFPSSQSAMGVASVSPDEKGSAVRPGDYSDVVLFKCFTA